MGWAREQGLKSFSSHKGWVVAVSWRPGSSLQFGTASHDRTVKLWDVRAAVPLHTVTDHTDKARSLPNRVWYRRYFKHD